MINDTSVLFVKEPQGPNGVALVWIIDGECLYDIPTSETHADMFKTSDKVIDISSLYPDHNGMTIRFIKNGTVINEFQTSEYFGSILLSNPTILNLNDYPYGLYVQSPYATFDGQKFIITDRNMSELLPWHITDPRLSENNQV